jgi:hypothetical protein
VIVVPEPEHVTVKLKDHLDANAEVPGQFSAGSYGCLGAILIWTLGWITVAYLAISRASRSPNVSALIGALVSGLVAFIGCRISLRVLRRHSPVDVPSISGYVSMPRRVTGWIAALVWCGVAVAWNLGVFGMLFKFALAGDGWIILLMLFWSLIGLVLLFILLTGIGVVIDSLLDFTRRGEN